MPLKIQVPASLRPGLGWTTRVLGLRAPRFDSTGSLLVEGQKVGFQATLTHPGDRLVTGLPRAWGGMSSQAQREGAGGMGEGVSRAAGQQDSCGNTQAGRGGRRAVHGDCSGCTDAEQLLLDLAKVKPLGKAGPLRSEDRAG